MDVGPTHARGGYTDALVMFLAFDRPPTRATNTRGGIVLRRTRPGSSLTSCTARGGWRRLPRVRLRA